MFSGPQSSLQPITWSSPSKGDAPSTWETSKGRSSTVVRKGCVPTALCWLLLREMGTAPTMISAASVSNGSQPLGEHLGAWGPRRRVLEEWLPNAHRLDNCLQVTCCRTPKKFLDLNITDSGSQICSVQVSNNNSSRRIDLPFLLKHVTVSCWETLFPRC